MLRSPRSLMMDWNVSEILDHAPIAIIILNQPITCSTKFLLSLWERALIRITADGGSNRWLSFIQSLPSTVNPPSPPHRVTGDLDSITNETKACFNEWRVQIQPTPDQDETDFTKALRVVSQMEAELNVKVQYVVCVCEHSGRLDHILANLETLHLAEGWSVNWRPILLTANSLTWLLPPGEHAIHVPPNNVTSGLPCGLIPLKGPATVTTNGLKWDLDQGLLHFGGMISTSNTFNSSKIEIKTSSELIWTTQFNDSATLETHLTE